MATDIAGLLWLIAALAGVTIPAVALGRRPAARQLTYGASLAICAALFVFAIRGILTVPADPQTITVPIGLPWTGANFRLDAVSMPFLAVVDFGGAIASLYALGYGRHDQAPHRVLPFYPLFLAGMNTVVVADDAFTFLVAWEFMSLTSWAIVLADHRLEDNARAGYIYLFMAAAGTSMLMLVFGLLAGPGGSYTFAAIRAAPPATGLAGLVMVLALVGAGSKAGLVPLHVWLPLAHPAAPSHVSALMSGVMTKVAIYGFVRIVFDLLGPPVWWWSMIVLSVAAATAVMGVLYALMQDDIKRLLAYSTVENVGIIFIGLGLALAFRAHGLDGPAALALTASILHVVNHSVFKSLLFFGAGAVLTATGERDMNRLGGLIHRMPQTAFVFLIGSAAIAALPPLNGFVSEWMTFQAILLSPQLPSWGLKFLVPATGALLALSAALAAACFVRAFGITFLGRPRSDAAAGAIEVDRFSRAAMWVLAAICLVAGVLPGLFIDALAPVVGSLIGTAMPRQTDDAWLSVVPVAESRSSYNGLLVFAFMAASAWMAALAIHRFASRAVRRGPAWDCGTPNQDPATQYSPSSFAQPVRRVFGSLVFSARETIDVPSPGDAQAARFDLTMRDPVWEGLYAPLATAIGRVADLLNRLQFLTIRQFLSLVFAALVLLLLVLVLWQ